MVPLEGLVQNPKIDIVDGPFGSNLKASEYVQEGVPIVRLQNVGRSRFLHKNICFVTAKKAAELSRHSFIPGDIVVTKLGNPVGKACIIPKSLPEGIIPADIVRVRLDGLHSDPRYVCFAINSPTVIARINLEVKGTTRPRVNLKHIRKLQIPLASLPEQRRIAAILESLLSEVDVCLARLESIPAILKRLRQSVLAAACSGRLTTDWRKKQPDEDSGKDLLAKIKGYLATLPLKPKEFKQIESAVDPAAVLHTLGLEEVPETWAPCSIGNIGRVCNGCTPSRNVPGYWGGHVPWVSSGEVKSNLITATRECISHRGLTESSLKLLPKGTVLLAMIGEGKTRGQSAILDIDGTINQNVAGIVIAHGFIKPKFLWYWLQHQYSRTREVGSGSGPQALNCERVRELPFLLPSLSEQSEIVRRVESLFRLADQIEARYASAKASVDQLTTSILSKAFRGELVPQDSKDVPVSKLPERIWPNMRGGMPILPSAVDVNIKRRTRR